MRELSETEKKLALLVIREMDKNGRSLKDVERGADAVLKVFRDFTDAPRPHPVKRIIYSLLFPFSKPPLSNNQYSLRNVDKRPARNASDFNESFVVTSSNRKALVRYTWGYVPHPVIVKVQALVEREQGAGFDIVAGEAYGPFSSQETANGAAIVIATSWFEKYLL